MIDLDAYQDAVAEIWETLHPGETISDIGNSLAEECGEVNRAIIKRKRGSSRSGDWDRELRYESVDVLINLLAVAWKEEFSLAALLIERWPRYAEKIGSPQTWETPTPWPRTPPGDAPKAVDLIAEVLHNAFKGNTDIDLDMLAAEALDALTGDALTVQLRWYDGDGAIDDEGLYVLGREDRGHR